MSCWIIPGRFDFSISEAQWLSDLSGIDADLDAVLRLGLRFDAEAKRLSAIPGAGQGEWWDEVQSIGDIFLAAVVRYGRTLATGVRNGVPIEWIEALPAELQDTHRYIKTLRDKFAAHSVNLLEDNQVFVFLETNAEGTEIPVRITVDRGRQLMPSTKEVSRLHRLATTLKARVGAEIEAENAQLLQLAKRMPVEQIKSRGTESVAIPSQADAFRDRAEFK